MAGIVPPITESGTAVDPPASLAQQSARGASWLLVRRVAANAIRLVTIAVLARHLQPAEFGLAALAQVVVAFISLSGDAGVGTYVIADREAGWERRARSAFWLGLAIASGVLLLCAAAAPLTARFFGQPDLPLILLALAGAFFFRQAGAVPEALMRRRMAYGPLVARDTLADIGSAAVSLFLAVRGFGVWSLVLPQLVMEPIRAFSMFWIARWAPGASPGFRDWVPIARYSGHLMGNNLLVLVANDGDTLLIGRVLGPHALGFYNLAYQLSNIVGRNVTSVASSVALSALAAVRSEAERLRGGYLRILRTLSAIGLPVLLGLFVMAPEVVWLVYGDQWAPSVPLLRLLVVFTSVRIVTSPCGVIFNILGRPDIGWKYNLIFIPVYIGAILVGTRWGLIGVAAAVTGIRVAGALVPFHISTRMIGLSSRRAALDVLAVGRASLVMAAFIWAVNHMLMSLGLRPVVRLGLVIVAGAAVYGTVLQLLNPEVAREIRQMLRSMLPVGRRYRGAC